jgi:uncharacterized repeat protein (TIGR03806 family)
VPTQRNCASRLIGILLAALIGLPLAAPAKAPDYGIATRSTPKAYLNMPSTAQGELPRLLSDTGVFTSTAQFKLSDGLIPYDLAVAFWSDGAQKSRYVSIPKGTVGFSPNGEWKFPQGSVFVKTFDLPTDAANPQLKRRLETRILVRDSAGGVYGVVYKWRADGSDAELLPASTTEDIPIKDLNGTVHQQTWYFPSREDCLTCHTARAGGVLGLKTRQMNRSFAYPSGASDNELRAWNHLGLFSPALAERDIAALPVLAAADDQSRTLEDRARSYLDANCSQCHRPGGTVANFDARYDTPISAQALIDGPVLIDQGLDHPRVIAPHDIWRSVLYMRISTNDDIRMPPLARETVDQKGVKLLGEWINSLPGRDVLAPPAYSPAGGTYLKPVTVTLSSNEPGADIHYTLDGSVPGMSDPRYERPLEISGNVVLRARAFKEGFTRSITAQELFIVGN